MKSSLCGKQSVPCWLTWLGILTLLVPESWKTTSLWIFLVIFLSFWSRCIALFAAVSIWNLSSTWNEFLEITELPSVWSVCIFKIVGIGGARPPPQATRFCRFYILIFWNVRRVGPSGNPGSATGTGVTIWKASVMEYHWGFASRMTSVGTPLVLQMPQWNLQHACDHIWMIVRLTVQIDHFCNCSNSLAIKY